MRLTTRFLKLDIKMMQIKQLLLQQDRRSHVAELKEEQQSQLDQKELKQDENWVFSIGLIQLVAFVFWILSAINSRIQFSFLIVAAFLTGVTIALTIAIFVLSKKCFQKIHRNQ